MFNIFEKVPNGFPQLTNLFISPTAVYEFRTLHIFVDTIIV